jgi:hypothetical protein
MARVGLRLNENQGRLQKLGGLLEIAHLPFELFALRLPVGRGTRPPAAR